MYAKKSDLQIISVEREAAFLPAQSYPRRLFFCSCVIAPICSADYQNPKQGT